MKRGRYDDGEVERIKAAVNCRELAEHLGIEIASRAGREWTARCFDPDAHPHGDRTPSLSIGPKLFHCHGCGAGGDCFNLVEQLEGLDFKASLAWLRRYAGTDAGTTATARPARRRERPAGISPERVEAMTAIWELVEPLALTKAAKRWLQGRGIGPETAHALGCRDFGWPDTLDKIRAAVEGLSLDLGDGLKWVGLHNEHGRLWWPLRGDTRAAGLAVPVFTPGHAAPMAWRWRFYQPVVFGPGLVLPIKSMAQPGIGPAPLLGLRTCGELPAVGEARTVIICEGEPDWLSLHDAAGGRAAVLGLCATAGTWEPEWTEYLDGARRIVVMVHDDKGTGQKVCNALYLAAVRKWGKATAGARLQRYLVPGDDDCNDNHKRGELAALVERILARLERLEG